jgi:hypothetical protein
LVCQAFLFSAIKSTDSLVARLAAAFGQYGAAVRRAARMVEPRSGAAVRRRGTGTLRI